MSLEQNSETPEWQKFLQEDNKRLKNIKKKEKGKLVPIDRAKGQAVSLDAAETKTPAEATKYARLYDDFSILSDDAQEQITHEIITKRDSGGDPRELIARAIELVKAHKAFAQLGSEKPEDKDPQKEQWRRELDEIIEEFKNRKLNPKDKAGQSGEEEADAGKPEKGWVQ